MAAPNFEQVRSFNDVTQQLKQAAVDEFMEYVYDGMTVDEVIDAAATVAWKYEQLGCELGAQWYDLCAELAGIDAEPAEYPDSDYDEMLARADEYLKASEPGQEPQTVFNDFLQRLVDQSIRNTGNANLWRDYERGLAPGKWARVPVGDTCAWCMMLASNGAWYVSKETALGVDPGHYHDHCDCRAVYHADPEDIADYDQLLKYKSMYYDAEDLRMENANPFSDYKYPEDLQERVDAAKAAADPDTWTPYNETLIVMRYKYDLK